MGKVVVLLAVVALGFLFLVVWVQLDAPVEHVMVNGQLDDAERDQIRRVVIDNIDGGLLSADLNNLQNRIEALSWPRSVAIRRAWPAGLELHVDKPMVIAIWRDAYLGSDGQIVRLAGARSDLPTFDCSLSEPRLAMEVFHRLSEQSGLHGLEITRLSENELGEWVLTFSQGVKLRLGARDLTERFQRFLSVYRQRLAERFVEVDLVDARYANGVAVSWRTEEPSEAPGMLAAAKLPAAKLPATKKGTAGLGVSALAQQQF